MVTCGHPIEQVTQGQAKGIWPRQRVAEAVEGMRPQSVKHLDCVRGRVALVED